MPNTDAMDGQEQQERDAAQLAALGYKQQLNRAVGLWQNFTVGFTYLSPIAGVYPLFAFGLATAGASFFWSIPLVLIGQMFVMLTFSEVSSQFPLTGGIYQWAKRLVGPRYAWLSGWLYSWALMVTVASIAFSANTYAAPLFGYAPTQASTVTCAVVIIAIIALVNLLGVRRLAFFSTMGTMAELTATVGLGLFLLLFHRHRGVTVVLHHTGVSSQGYTGAFLAAALFSVWIFYGFEACGDIAEEVKNPSRKVPRAMRMTLGIGGLASAIITLGFIVAVPSISAVISGSDGNPIETVLSQTLGGGGTKVALAVIVFAFMSAAMSVQAMATRLVYSYARDGMIVGSRFLSNLHPKFQMPPGAVAVTAIIPAAITFLPSATVARIVTFAVVGIYVGYASVTLAAIIGRARGWKASGAFTLGRWGMVVNVLALIYGVSTMVVLSIKTPSTGPGFVDRWMVPISLAVVAACGLVYMLIARPREHIRADARADGGQAEEQLPGEDGVSVAGW
jgi:amino acid transporter